jgi:phage terminase small subunit
VLNDDWELVKEYCTNYGISMPANPDVMAAGIYKAVQECADIPDGVKVKAAMKCMKLGFKPFMLPIE